MKRLLHALAGEGPPLLGQAFEEAARARGIAPDAELVTLASVLAAAYPALRAQMTTRPEDVQAIARGRLRIARDLRAYRKLAAAFVPSLEDARGVRRGLRLFVQRERLRIAARELLVSEGVDVDTTARELSDLAQVSIEIAVAEAFSWAAERFGIPRTSGGERCAFTVLGMGKLGGRELNAGSDVDLLPFYETDDGGVEKDGTLGEHTLHEYFARVTQRFTASLEEVTDDGICWRVDLRLRPEGSRGPLVNSLAAAERYYETWGRTWERAALIRARPVGGDLVFGDRVLGAFGPFVWRKVVDPRISHEMTQLVHRARVELSTQPDRDLKLGPGGIREAEFFVQSLQLVWGGREPRIRHPNTLEALRRLRGRGLVTDRECREVEAAYLLLRRVEHRVQLATGIQTHTLPVGEALETVARSLGYANGHDLERDLDKTRRRVAARFASLTKDLGARDERFAGIEPLLSALDSGEQMIVLTALSESADGVDFSTSASPDLARHLAALARRPDLPLGALTRDRHPRLAHDVLLAIADAADPEQAARYLASFFGRLVTPSVYTRAMADDPHVLRKLVGLFGASAFLATSLVNRPALVESVLFTRGAPTPESTRRDIDGEIEAALSSALSNSGASDVDPEDPLVGALRRVKARVTMEVGLAELSGEITTRDATLVLSAAADATLEHATRRALSERALSGGLSLVAVGKLGGREIGYGSDLDLFFVFDAHGAADEDSLSEKYVRAAQRVLRIVGMPHGAGPGYELDTRLRPSGTQGLLVVSLEAFARYHGVSTSGEPQGAAPEAQDWERQALIKARPCAGDAALGRRVLAIVTAVAYERGAPEPNSLHRLRMRMERELAREGPSRYDVKLGRGGLADVEHCVQWLQMKYGGDPRVRTPETEVALGALEACGYLDGHVSAMLREGYLFLRRLEQALRVVHGTSASLIERGAPGIAALARRMGFRDGPRASAGDALLDRYRTITQDVRSAYLQVLGIEG